MFIQCISANNSYIFAWHVLMFNLKWNDCNCEDTICCVCAQIYLREQPFPEPFPWAALLLPLRWGADGSVGQSEGIWRRWVRSLTPQTFPLLYVAVQLTVSFFFPALRVSCDPLSKLPLPHKLAILATMDEVRTHWTKIYGIQNTLKNLSKFRCGEEKLNKNVDENPYWWVVLRWHCIEKVCWRHRWPDNNSKNSCLFYSTQKTNCPPKFRICLLYLIRSDETFENSSN